MIQLRLGIDLQTLSSRASYKSKKIWWRVAVGRADDIDGVGIVIAPYSAKMYSRKHIDSRWNPLSTHKYRERTSDHLLCERLQKCTLVIHQVIGSIPTGKGWQFLGSSLRWYLTPSDIIAKMHYQDCYRGWLQYDDIVFYNTLWGWYLGDVNQVRHTDFQGGPQHSHRLAWNNQTGVSWTTRLAWHYSRSFSAVYCKHFQGWLDHDQATLFAVFCPKCRK